MNCETAQKPRPIIFSPPMVRAILAGKKTQTRRIVKPQPPSDTFGDATFPWFTRDCARWAMRIDIAGNTDHVVRCPYGAMGDTLWVRETWCPRSGGMLAMDSICRPRYRADGELRPEWGFKWKSPYHMPQKFSRITLEITSIRVERLQDISEADAIAEGLPSKLVNDPLFKPDAREYWSPLGWCMTPEIAYEALWDSLNRSRAPWSSNPWVWVLEFQKECQ